ncbi:C-C chemokine receptor type 6 [Bombina bombina]|uniref:C-C chemokine receptor type 6 n=1 Tax=Bombina bombina TaxID=8345 RepID=UPI00235ABAA0|nr:C-C chemokine receptor type 6 [Bombina bombina]
MENFTATLPYYEDEFYTDDFNYDEDGMICNMEIVRRFIKTFSIVTYTIMFAWGLVGNLLVVLTFGYYKRTKSMTDVYLLNLAVADILFILTLPFWAVYKYKNEWIFKDFMCKVVRSIYKINFNCSMLLLAFVGIDRYIAIVQVTRSFNFRATAITYKKWICLFVWVITIAISGITYAFNAAYKHDNQWVCEANYINNSTPVRLKLAVLAVQVSIGFFIPFLIMLFCYTFIIKTLLQAHNSQRHKAIRVVIAVASAFLLCQVPYNILLLIEAATLGKTTPFCSEKVNIAYAMFITETLAFFHCCLNPMIYAFVGVKFRNSFLKIIQDLLPRKHKYFRGNRSSRISSDTYTCRQTSEVYTKESGSSFTM